MQETELYHHGILGQRWGVRRFQNYDGSLTSRGKTRELKSAGQYKRALNDIDKGIAQERRDYSDSRNAVAWMHKQTDKLMKKANKKEATGDYADRFNKKIDKYEKAADDHNRQANEHMANVFKGQELTKKLIAEAEAKGYVVSSKATQRNVTRGSEYVADTLGLIGAYALGSPVAFVGYSTMKGTKYKVRKPKE